MFITIHKKKTFRTKLLKVGAKITRVGINTNVSSRQTEIIYYVPAYQLLLHTIIIIVYFFLNHVCEQLYDIKLKLL